MQRTAPRTRGTLLVPLALAGCFSPEGPSADPTGGTTIDATTTTTATGPSTSTGPGPTGDPGTSEPPTTAGPATTPDPTGTDTGPDSDPETGATTMVDECDGKCEPPTPYCLPNAECGDCLELDQQGTPCSAVDPDHPYCHPQLGMCVGCVTDADCPIPNAGICNEYQHLCSPCRMHSDCPDTACDMYTGLCFPPEATVHTFVDAVQACNDGPCDTMQTPCCEIGKAVEVAISSQLPYSVVHVVADQYFQPIKITTNGEIVAVLADPGAKLSANVMGAPAIQLGDTEDDIALVTSRLYISKLTVTGGVSGHGVRVWRASIGMWFDDSTVVAHGTGPALSAVAGKLTVRRSVLQNNVAGVDIDGGGHVVLENTQVANAPTAIPALSVKMNGRLELLYSTIADRNGQPHTLLDCDPTAILDIRNSALLASPEPNMVDCMSQSMTITHSILTNPMHASLSSTNKVLAAADVPALFVDWMGGGLDLVGGGLPLVDVAQWHGSDPPTDLHLAPRPTVPDAPDVAGADLP